MIGAFWALRRKRLIDDLPTSKTRGVFVGLTELKGTAESEMPLVSYLGGSKCVYYDWHVDEHWSRTVHETYTDSKGHVQTRTRTETGWTKVADGHDSIRFYLQDDTGAVRIDPEAATINATVTYNETCQRNDPLYFGKGPAKEIANTTHQRRFHEVALPLHTNLYVLGQARERDDAVAAEIAYQRGSPAFLISTKTERQISSGYGWWFLLWLVLGAFAVAGFVVASTLTSGSAFRVETLVVALAAYAFAFILGWVWMVYNSLITLHHRVEQGWSQVEIELKRRNDLIPNLVSCVEGYSDFEKGTQQTVTAMRAQLAATAPGMPGPDFKGVLPRLKVAVEAYPILKSSEIFMGLQKSLSDTEERIALARDYFNQIATFYNSRLEIVPDRFAGTLARLRRVALMNASDFERARVEVKFQN